MSLELLPDEILLYMFEFLKTSELIRAFCCLNKRCNALLFSHMEKNGIDFRSISKKNFEFICQNQLSPIASNITTLCLSDDDETPYQSNLLLRNGFTLNQFTSLKSLSLYELRSDKTCMTLINGLSHLSNLTDLKLIKCYVENMQSSCTTIMNQIWSLPELTHCHFDIKFQNDVYLANITSRSSSLKHLTIDGVSCCLFELSNLFKHTPNLEFISLKSRDKDQRRILPAIPSLTTLELHVQDHNDMMMNLLYKTRNLCHLKVKLYNLYLNGQQWEEIINTHLPQLKILQFRMNYNCPITNYTQEIDQLLSSFRSQFWLQKYKWYVRCHWFRSDLSCYICVFTIPYAFSDLSFLINTSSKSTCPNDVAYRSYDHVHTISDEQLIWSNTSEHSQARFPNIHHLCVSRSDDNQLGFVTGLNKLKSLEVLKYASRSSVQTFLNQTTNLYSLTLTDPMFMLTNPSIRRLDLLNKCDYLTKEQCDELNRSSLIGSCEVLLIKITNPMYIIPLLNNMHQLRALTIQCQNDYWSQSRCACIYTTLEKLRSHLPQTAEIDRDPKFRNHIRIWLR
jgi:hypothetical protein